MNKDQRKRLINSAIQYLEQAREELREEDPTQKQLNHANNSLFTADCFIGEVLSFTEDHRPSLSK